MSFVHPLNPLRRGDEFMTGDSRLSDLLGRWEQSRGEHELRPEDLCGDCPELLEELRRAIDQLTELEVVVGPDDGPDPDQGQERTSERPDLADARRSQGAGSRYRPLFLHARGNLGKVYVARDEALRRKVALKVIRERKAVDRDSLRRFRQEAEITGRLEHPGIVPVYGMGDYGDGRPCYAMRFLGRETLETRIGEFHAADRSPRDPARRNLMFRKLLGSMISVCNTVAYAHSRGILHRDLKPANILIGKYGETLVVDWGLAKPFERGEEARATGEETLDPNPSGGELNTRGLVGTPAFMSPEQADYERLHLVGPASDIANLGATLYMVLTGHPPYRGATVSEVLEKVRRWEFAAPRQVRQEVPATLEAICVRAMAREPQDRHGSARDLADDLEQWLADEPILAFRSPVADYERLSRDHPKMLKYREGLARNRTDLGNILHALGRDTEAEQVYREASADYQRLVNRQPLVLQYQEGLASSYMRLGRALKALGKEPEAKDAYGRALAEYERLVAAAPDALDYRMSLEASVVLAGAGVRVKPAGDGPKTPSPIPAEESNERSADRDLIGPAAGAAASIDQDGTKKAQNLLEGLLAVHTGFASRPIFQTSIKSWLPDKSRSLLRILRDLGALTNDVEEMLQSLTTTLIRQHQGDAEESLSMILQSGPMRSELEQIADSELLALLARVSDMQSVDELIDTVTEGGLTSAQRFRLLRPHARGGLSQVWIARDEQLNREVAIKQIVPRFGDWNVLRNRFLFEATVTGSLEHPGIVPVYCLGHTSDGRPFYAMRFIQGTPFSQSIDAFHEINKDPRRLGTHSLELRRLLFHLINVCKTVSYAHSRGVIHRDLKPSNIMIGRYGETLLLDWGLAKYSKKSDSEGTQEGAHDAEETELRMATRDRDAWGQTMEGTVIGTPSYMSPEQAQGRIEEIGPASDIYGVGATLYSLLTGHSPHEESGTAMILGRAARGEIRPPRTYERQIPSDLEAICLKAMALNPADRYPSAEALSSDIERWLGGQPVSAFPEPWTARLLRWVRG
jgi:serine/threonine protein kinase